MTPHDDEEHIGIVSMLMSNNQCQFMDHTRCEAIQTLYKSEYSSHAAGATFNKVGDFKEAVAKESPKSDGCAMTKHVSVWGFVSTLMMWNQWEY